MEQYFSNTVLKISVLKVGEQMDKKETIKNIINNNCGIAKTADFVAEGLSNYDVANLCKEGYLERVRHGYYQLAEQEEGGVVRNARRLLHIVRHHDDGVAVLELAREVFDL